MTEERKHYDAGQPVDRLERINVTTASQSDVLWLVAEVERLREQLLLRDAYLKSIGADIDKVCDIGRAALREAE